MQRIASNDACYPGIKSKQFLLDALKRWQYIQCKGNFETQGNT